MNLTRRRFLATSGAVIAGAAVPGTLALKAATKDQAVSAAVSDWESVRSLFKLSKDYLHFSSFFISSHPKPVQDAIDKYRREIDDNPFITVEHGLFNSGFENKPQRVRQAAAEYLGANADEIVLTGSTTMGLALIYNGLKIRNGQEILVTVHDHYSHHESIRLSALKNGAQVRKIALFDQIGSVSEESIVERILSALKPETRVIGLTWVHSSTGLKLPLTKISKAIAEANANRKDEDRILIVVDGVHGLGVENVTVQEIGCDFLAAGTHKWMFGPRGTGIVWAKKDVIKNVEPTIPSFSAGPYEAWMSNQIPGPAMAEDIAPGGFHAFEHQWAIAEAFRLHLQIGKEKIEQRIHSLNKMCKEGLAKMKHVQLYTPIADNLSAGIICFDVNGMKPRQVVEKLFAKKIVASETPYGVSYARLAPSLVNTEQEVETVLREISELKS